MGVALLWQDGRGVAHSTIVGTISSTDGKWAPSSVLPLASAVPLTESGSTQTVQIELLSDAQLGTWEISGVYADPYSKGCVAVPTAPIDPAAWLDALAATADSSVSS